MGISTVRTRYLAVVIAGVGNNIGQSCGSLPKGSTQYRSGLLFYKELGEAGTLALPLLGAELGADRGPPEKDLSEGIAVVLVDLHHACPTSALF
jgi:hypothetical protein